MLPLSASSLVALCGEFSHWSISLTRNRPQVATVTNHLLAKQSIARQGVPCHCWEPSNTIIKDVKGGHCYQRQKEKESHAKMSDMTKLDECINVAGGVRTGLSGVAVGRHLPSWCCWCGCVERLLAALI